MNLTVLRAEKRQLREELEINKQKRKALRDEAFELKKKISEIRGKIVMLKHPHEDAGTR